MKENMLFIKIKLSELFIHELLPLIWIEKEALYINCITQSVKIESVNYMINYVFLKDTLRKQLHASNLLIRGQYYSKLIDDKCEKSLTNVQTFESVDLSRIAEDYSLMTYVYTKGLMLISDNLSEIFDEIRVSLLKPSLTSCIDVDKHSEGITFTNVNSSNGCVYIPFDCNELSSFRNMNSHNCINLLDFKKLRIRVTFKHSEQDSEHEKEKNSYDGQRFVVYAVCSSHIECSTSDRVTHIRFA